MNRTPLISALALAGLVSYGATEPTRLLFINNSLTFFNDLPSLVDSLGKHANPPIEINSAMRSIPGSDLYQHLSAECFAAIRTGRYDYVVLQGYGDPLSNRDRFFSASRQLNDSIRTAGAATVLFMTWPPEEGIGSFDVLMQNYDSIAVELRALVAPVGRAWWLLLDGGFPREQLYSDMVHPTLPGSYVAACVIFATIFQGSPVGNTFDPVVTPFRSEQYLRSCDSSGAALQRISWSIAQDYNGLPRPVFSPLRATFWNPMAVTLSATLDSGAVIRYSTDGNDPVAASTPYSGPIPLAATTTVKAACFKDGVAPGLVVTKTYRKVDPPVLSELVMNPVSNWVLPKDSLRFSAACTDQYGYPLAVPLSWSVSGGGTVSESGVFAGNGQEGIFTMTVRDVAGTTSRIDTFAVGRGVALPSGYLKSMLSLRDTGGSSYLTHTGDLATDYLHGESSADPCAGQTISIHGVPCSWQWAHSGNSWWADEGGGRFVAYWAVAVACTIERRVQVKYQCGGNAKFWANGAVFLEQPEIVGVDSIQTTDTVLLPPGRSRFLFKMTASWGQRDLRVSLVNTDGSDINGIYCLNEGPLDPPTSRAGDRRAMKSGGPIKLSVKITSRRILLEFPNRMTGVLCVFDMRGRTVYRTAVSGKRRVDIDRSDLPNGSYRAWFPAAKQNTGTSFVLR